MSATPVGTQPLELQFSVVIEGDSPPQIDEADLEYLTRHVLAAENARGVWEITVALVAGARLRELHRDFLGVDAETDIMTFPVAESGEDIHGGELVISLDHAKSRAQEWGLTPADEIRFLIAHGLLHLLGWRDDGDEDRRRMLDRQSALLARRD